MNNTNKTLILMLLLAVGLGCGYSSPKTSTPNISQLSPASTTAGGAQFQLEVDGANFASNAVVSFNGTAEPTTVVSSTKVEAMIPAAGIMSAATVPVTVTNPGAGGVYGGMGSVTSAPMNFTIH
jgi:hypothetical protein